MSLNPSQIKALIASKEKEIGDIKASKTAAVFWKLMLQKYVDISKDEISNQKGIKKYIPAGSPWTTYYMLNGSTMLTGGWDLAQTATTNTKITALRNFNTWRTSTSPTTPGGNVITGWSGYFGVEYTLTQLQNLIEKANKKIAAVNEVIDELDKKIKKLQKEIKDLQNQLPKNQTPITPTPSEDDEVKPITRKEALAVQYKMNIPMVKSAYYQKGKEHIQMTLAKHPNWTILDNGRKMWLGENGGKGVIQADAQMAKNFKNKTWRDNYGLKDKQKNKKIYGFRFMYNPMTVEMNWGVVQEMDPVTLSLGLDKAIPIAPGLASSSVSFELMLNRLEDMNHIDKNGWRPQGSGRGDAGEEAANPYNPWPLPGMPGSFNDDLKQIYRRGTMYDLEHLFAAQFAVDPFYKSTLNGKTADYGWLTGFACELHLGSGLRYKVRIESLSVNHIVFNERMVPLLTNVNIRAARYPDFTQKEEDKYFPKSTDGGYTDPGPTDEKGNTLDGKDRNPNPFNR